MTKYTRLNVIFGWIAFLIATTVYTLTLEPTGSFWDCGEFIASAYKLQVCHQPGAPLFLMISKVLSLMASDVTQVAWWTNFGSALSSGATIMFLFWTITHLAKKLIARQETEMETGELIAVLGAGMVGALAYTFSDTFWFSAVESEVYAMSSLCTAIVFWAILKWENVALEKGGDKWLLLIAYVMGLSIGVHLLNLLTIPALGMVYYFKKHETTTKGALIAFFTSCAILVFVLYGLIPGTISAAAKFDLYFVNTLGFGFGSGVMVYVVLLITLLITLLVYTEKGNKNLLYFAAANMAIQLFWGANLTTALIFCAAMALVLFVWKPEINRYILNTSVLCTVFILIGYMSYAMIVIRAHANPPLNNNDASNAYSFLSYLNREQYGDTPLIFGPNFTTEMKEQKEGDMMYRAGATRYEEIGTKPIAVYDKEILFPRIYSNSPGHVQFYKSWLGITGEPTYLDNIKFFFSYQINFMYMRYFMWNFVGRQNDIAGAGSVHEGNWISGIKPLDAVRLGSQDALPKSMTENKAHNRLYFLPMILGLLGLFYHLRRNVKDFSTVLLLFFMTGLAIVLYLNQSPLQPRERDYAYVGSFYAFAIWIGLGVLAIYEFLNKKVNLVASAGISTALCLVAVPALMAKEEWNDHDRSNRYISRDLGKNYMNSCAENAILFTYGDNDTYELWYGQEVEGIRPDMRLINLSLLGTDWLGRQMKNKMNESAPIKISLANEQFAAGIRDYTPFWEQPMQGPVELKDLIAFISSDEKEAKAQTQGGAFINYMPTKQVKITIDKDKMIKNGLFKESERGEMLDEIVWTIPNNGLYKNDLLALDIIAQNIHERPIYYTISSPDANYIGLKEYFRNEGLAYRIVPMKNTEKSGLLGDNGSVKGDELYDIAMNKYDWGTYNNGKIYIDPESSRSSTTNRLVYVNLAEAMMKEGKKDSTTKVLDRMNEAIPFIPGDVGFGMITEVIAADLYFQAGQAEKATKTIDRSIDYINDQLNYYHSLGTPLVGRFSNEIRAGLSLINEFADMAKRNNQTALEKKLENQLDALGGKFQMVMGDQ